MTTSNKQVTNLLYKRYKLKYKKGGNAMLNSQVKQVVALEDQAVTGREMKWGFWRAVQVVSWCKCWFNRCVQFAKILHTHVHFSVGLLFKKSNFSQAISLSIIKKKLKSS